MFVKYISTYVCPLPNISLTTVFTCEHTWARDILEKTVIRRKEKLVSMRMACVFAVACCKVYARTRIPNL